MTTTCPDVQLRDRIIEAVCKHYGVSLYEMFTPEDGGQITSFRFREARMMFAVLMKMHTRYSYPEIAEMVNLKSHSSINTCVATFGQKPEGERKRLLKPFVEVDIPPANARMLVKEIEAANTGKEKP